MIRLTMAAAALAVASFAPGVSANAQDINSSITEEADGTRTLVHESIIDVPIAQLWESFTTVEGWKLWGPQEAWIDLRLGGTIESSYTAGAEPGDPTNIVHRILAMVPERMIATRLDRIPEGGPVPASVMQATWAVYEMEPVDDERTRLRITGLGYLPGEEFDRVIGFFESGNTYSIQLLQANIAARENAE